MSGMDEAWSVTRLARTIKRRVEDEFPAVWVKGELVGVKRYPSGHWYFGLRDAEAKVDCTMWKFAAARLKGPLEEGTEVFVLGTPNVWEERTSLRFNVTQVLPASGVGAQAQAVEQIKQRLLVDGLLDPARKRPLPPYATRIAVVTSIAGAAVRDIITVAARRWPGVELLVVNSAVQGDGAPQELVDALAIVSRLERIDCCIIGRGGGSKEDLAAFNDEALCRAIASCPVPVISAVGHEVDVTLADLVADVRAATPSQAAEFALPDRMAVQRLLSELGSRLFGMTLATVGEQQLRLERTRDRMTAALTTRLRTVERRLLNVHGRLAPALTRHVTRPREKLLRLEATLAPAMRRQVTRRQADTARLAAQLDALSPVAVLGRGFAVPLGDDQRVLRTTADFTVGRHFNLRVADGTVEARVEESP
ncbi:MAG: exodeoxyribonuclease VII large subunit [Gemmatimonadales bacterium]